MAEIYCSTHPARQSISTQLYKTLLTTFSRIQISNRTIAHIKTTISDAWYCIINCLVAKSIDKLTPWEASLRKITTQYPKERRPTLLCTFVNHRFEALVFVAHPLTPLPQRMHPPQLVSDADEIISKLLHRVSRRSRLHSLGIMRDENSLGGLDDDDALFALP